MVRYLLTFLLLLSALSAAGSAAAASTYADEGRAYAGCMAEAAKAGPVGRPPANGLGFTGAVRCTHTVGTTGSSHNWYACQYQYRWATGSAYDNCASAAGYTNEHRYPIGSLCASRPEIVGMTGPAKVCDKGCVNFLYNDPSVGSYYSTFDSVAGKPGGVCTVSDFPEPKPDSDGDGVPDDEDAFPNDPNESVDTDGDGIGDNADIAPDDPDNGKDDGEGDEKDNKAGGGGDCKTPPTCSGDGIQCNQLYQLWRARCAVEGQGGSVTGAPGDCKATYKCEGNSVACAQLAVQRQQLCGTGDGDGDGHGTVTGTGSCESAYVCTGGDPAACAVLLETHRTRCLLSKLVEGDGDDSLGDDNEPSDFFGVGAESADLGLLDSNGWLSSRSCPAVSDPDLAQLGSGVQKGLTSLCNGAGVLGVYILILGFMHAAFILGRAASGSAT